MPLDPGLVAGRWELRVLDTGSIRIVSYNKDVATAVLELDPRQAERLYEGLARYLASRGKTS